MNKYSLEIRWGLLFAGITFLWMTFEKAMGWYDELTDKPAIYSDFFGFIAISHYVVALSAKRKQLGGEISWRRGFIAGLIMTAIFIALSPLSQWLINAVILPEYFSNAMQYALEYGKVTQEEAESWFNLRYYITQAILQAAIMGTVTSAIFALFVRTK